jgi:signal transduction histidine kinase/CheY-like chemotaxis protein
MTSGLNLIFVFGGQIEYILTAEAPKMTHVSPDIVSEPQIPLSKLQALQFEWLSRASRLCGMATLVVDTELEIKFYDSRFAEILELDTSIDYRGKNLLDVTGQLALRGDFGPGDPQIFVELVKAQFCKPISSPEKIGHIMDFLTPSGRRVEFSQDQEDDGLFVLGCRDVTKSYVQKHALKVALDSSKSGYIIYDIETKRFQAYSDVSRSGRHEDLAHRLVKDDLKNLINTDDYAKLRVAWRRAHAARQPWTGTFRTKDNQADTIWVKFQATPQISESGIITSYIFFYTEVTAQLRVQDDLRKAIEQSEKALSAKNAFLGRLSHEIRTPMNAVVGIADALIHHDGNPKIMPKLELIQTSAEKIIRIVDESLEHTKLAESMIQLDPHASSPIEAVEAVCALWEQKAVENGIDLKCRIDPSVPESIIFDSHRYEQCLNNLISNAVKFSPAGQILVVLTTLEKSGQNNLVTVVKDTGIGMNEAQLAKLFEAYTQADQTIAGRFGGTGLGMNITKQLIELMDGKISAKSEPGEGTVIALTLPIQEDRREENRRRNETSEALVDNMLEGAAPPASEYASLKVLVVDDNATNHMVVTSLLGTLVKHIDVAENGIEAIQALETAHEANAQYDVVLMDIHMPVMDGIEATLAIRGSKKPFTDIPIIALTADPQYQQRRLCKNIGMDDALAKPIKLTEVLGAMDRVFAGQVASDLAA